MTSDGYYKCDLLPHIMVYKIIITFLQHTNLTIRLKRDLRLDRK